MRKFGVEGKKRFTIKYENGEVFRCGTCDPKEDERYDVIEVTQKRQGANGEIESYQQYVLVRYPKDDFDYSKQDIGRRLLPEGTLIANGYYDHENDEFVKPEKWIKQT